MWLMDFKKRLENMFVKEHLDKLVHFVNQADNGLITKLNPDDRGGKKLRSFGKGDSTGL